jgi:hypothetical protein
MRPQMREKDSQRVRSPRVGGCHPAESGGADSLPRHVEAALQMLEVARWAGRKHPQFAGVADCMDLIRHIIDGPMRTHVVRPIKAADRPGHIRGPIPCPPQ